MSFIGDENFISLKRPEGSIDDIRLSEMRSLQIIDTRFATNGVYHFLFDLCIIGGGEKKLTVNDVSMLGESMT